MKYRDPASTIVKNPRIISRRTLKTVVACIRALALTLTATPTPEASLVTVLGRTLVCGSPGKLYGTVFGKTITSKYIVRCASKHSIL